MLRLLRIQLKKLLHTPLFYCSLLGIAMLCSFSSVINNYATSEEGDVIAYCLALYTRKKMLSDISFSSFHIFSVGGKGAWMHLFIPVLVSIAAVNVYCDEEKSGEKRFSIFRTGRRNYYFGNILFFLISGALVAVLGYLIFGLFANTFFPHRSAYTDELLQEYTQIYFSNNIILGKAYAMFGMKMVYFLKLFSFGLYGMVSVIPALVLSAFVRNKYLITCIPFFIGDVLRQISNLIYLQGRSIDLSEDGSEKVEKLTQLAQMVSPDTISEIFSLDKKMTCMIVMIDGSILILGIVLTFYIMRTGVDKGE